MADAAEPTQQKTPPKSGARSDDLTGRTLGDFLLERRIGQGGMGQVYLATQLSLGRKVAVKLLRTDVAAKESTLIRFKQEAQAVAKITHPNIVQVYSIGETDGLHYMALEFVEGKNLREYLNKKGRLDAPLAMNIMRQVASALMRADELGFVHRDIKPENILLTRKGEAKVADFGLSRCFASEEQLSITQSGVTLGTPLYMSPEQVQGKAVDPRSDIYSFGVTSYHMLAGSPPFRGNTAIEVALQHLQNEPPSLQEIRPDVPAELIAIINKMMAKSLDDRYQTAREVLRDLTRLRDSMALQNANLTQQLSTALPLEDFEQPAGSSIPLDATQALVRRRPSLNQCLIGLGVALVAGVAGVGLHWKLHPAVSAGNVVTEELPQENPPENPNRQKERELLRKLAEREPKPDSPPVDAVLELAMLYISEKRFDEAKKLFDFSELIKKPCFQGIPKADSPLAPDRKVLPAVCDLGSGILLAYEDKAKESIEAIRKALAKEATPKDVKTARNPLALFLSHHPLWKKTIGDALDRDARNEPGSLDTGLNLLRNYGRMP